MQKKFASTLPRLSFNFSHNLVERLVINNFVFNTHPPSLTGKVWYSTQNQFNFSFNIYCNLVETLVNIYFIICNQKKTLEDN